MRKVTYSLEGHEVGHGLVKGTKFWPQCWAWISQCISVTSGFPLESEDSGVGPARLSAQTVSLILALTSWPTFVSGVWEQSLSGRAHALAPAGSSTPGWENTGWVRCSALSPAVTVTHEILISSCALRI